MSAIRTTTVAYLLGILRQALTALVPVVEMARMPWRDGEAYDDWDAIAECLYDNLVVRTLVYAREAGMNLELPKYDLVYSSYKGTFIQVEGPGIPAEVTAVFIGFAGISPDFADVKWIRVLPSGDIVGQEIGYSPFAACRFYLVRRIGNERTRLHTVTIDD